MAETGKEENMEVDGTEDMINMTMEQWLNDCRARMTDLLMELCTFNARQFTTERRAFHDASFKRFLDIPIEMFAIMCATEIEKYKTNLEEYMKKMELVFNPDKLPLEYPNEWKHRMLSLLTRIIQVVEYVPEPAKSS